MSYDYFAATLPALQFDRAPAERALVAADGRERHREPDVGLYVVKADDADVLRNP